MSSKHAEGPVYVIFSVPVAVRLVQIFSSELCSETPSLHGKNSLPKVEIYKEVLVTKHMDGHNSPLFANGLNNICDIW
jgi:hypothetical protein